MLRNLPLTIAVLCLTLTTRLSGDDAGQKELTRNQKLIVAAFELDVSGVTSLLKEGADPNATFGIYDKDQFADKWTFGYSGIGSNNWTALLAVAESNREPQPTEYPENTAEGRDAARRKRDSLDPRLIRERDTRRVAIAKLLIAAGADLDRDDGWGATALARSTYNRYDDLSLLLIESGAKLDTKTKVYIDGPGNITPLHWATRSSRLLKAMLKRGANVNVKTTSGDTPLHWAARDSDVEIVKLLLAAGADVHAEDNEGHKPSYWVRPYFQNEYSSPEDKAIAKLIADAEARK